MASKLLYSLVVAIVVITLSQVMFPLLVSADTDTDTFNVSITVDSVAAIDVNPNSTDFGTIAPGAASEEKSIQIENIGSLDITKIWANATMASSNPYGTGQASAYNAGDFVLITNDSSENQPFYYVNSIFFNESKPPYVTAPSGWSEGWNSGYFIRIRTVDFSNTGEGEEYFAFTKKGTTNCTDGTVYIGKNPHTKTQTGTIDFQSGDFIQISSLTTTNNGLGAYGKISGFGNKLDDHYIYVNASCDYIILYRWNRDLGGGDYLFQGTLKPGATLDWKVEARVPYGVAAGSIQEGMITFIASTL